MTRYSRTALMVLVSLTALGACRRQPAPPPPAPVVDNSAEIARQAEAARAAAAAARADSIRRAEEAAAAERRRIEEERARAVAAARSAVTSIVYFDYDQSDLTMQARNALDSKIPVLNANPGLRIRIAGHTDNRGSDEYNQALGQRRAAAAKRYLTDRGIADARIDIVSFGEDRPAAMGDNESAWAQNRRAEFEIIAGGDNIVPPR
jgi:peptidoglycan-associated lipoprotein